MKKFQTFWLLALPVALFTSSGSLASPPIKGHDVSSGNFVTSPLTALSCYEALIADVSVTGDILNALYLPATNYALKTAGVSRSNSKGRDFNKDAILCSTRTEIYKPLYYVPRSIGAITCQLHESKLLRDENFRCRSASLNWQRVNC